MKYIASEYDNSDPRNFGVFFEGKAVYDVGNKKYGKRHYFFRLLVAQEEYIFTNGIPFETIEFWAEVDLTDFCEYETIVYYDEGVERKYDRYDLNATALVEKLAPELFDQAKCRLERRCSQLVPDANLYVSNAEQHKCFDGREFLWFTDESAYSWAGPLEMDGKFGCVMRAGKNMHLSLGIAPVFDVKTQFSYFDLPRSRMWVKEDEKLRARITHATPEWKEAFFRGLSISDQHAVLVSYIGKKLHDSELLYSWLPWEIYLSGNDDCSYTKWFATEQEMYNEIEYLRKMQPLDFAKDIVERGYFFTN